MLLCIRQTEAEVVAADFLLHFWVAGKIQFPRAVSGSLHIAERLEVLKNRCICCCPCMACHCSEPSIGVDVLF